jgi:hypothetical protein
MPLEVAHVPGLQVDRLSVVRTENRDARERTPIRLCEQNRWKKRRNEKEPMMLDHFFSRP